MLGHLDLLAARGEDGRTVLRKQSFAAPIHVSKPHHDAGWLVVNLASPTPGLFEGDRVRVDVRVEEGARLLLTAPSANRIHTMKEGQAELGQTFHVAAGACLEVWPEYLIPQAEARYRQQTRITVETGGTLLWTETMAPGRVARGEAFAFRELRFATDIFHGTRPLVRERYEMTRENLAAMRAKFPEGYYASIVAVRAQPGAGSFGVEAIHGLHHSASRWVGVTRLSESAVAIKIVAADSPGLREAVGRARTEMQKWLGVEAAALRRVTGAPG